MTTARGSGTPAALRSFESLLSNAWHVFSVQAVLSPTLHSSFQQTCWTRFGSTVPGKGLLSTLSALAILNISERFPVLQMSNGQNDLSPESVFCCRKFGLSLPPPLLPPLKKVSSVASHPAPGPKKTSARQARSSPPSSLQPAAPALWRHVGARPSPPGGGCPRKVTCQASSFSRQCHQCHSSTGSPMQMLHGFL